MAKCSSATWDDSLIEHNVIGRLIQVLPALIVFVGTPFVPDLVHPLVRLSRNVATGYMVLVSTMALTVYEIVRVGDWIEVPRFGADAHVVDAQLHNGMTLTVRQLAPGPAGLTLEVYCVTNTTVWIEYEDIQADMNDHQLAIVP